MSSTSTLLLDRLEVLASDVAARRRHRRSRAGRLADVLLWTEQEELQVNVPGATKPASVLKTLVGSQPAAVFVASAGVGDDLIDGTALFAYHCSVEWGVIASPDQITVINSHWVRGTRWFSLPPIKWSQISRYVDVLEALTPEGLAHGRIDTVAVRFAQPDRFLKPVDDALVDRLDYWRAEVARFSPDMSSIDEQLHRIFAQLFVLRAAEDRRLTTKVAPLSTTLKSDSIDVAALSEILRTAKEELQSELFDTREILSIPPAITKGIVKDLYFPRDLPTEAARYNFEWIDADVLGRAYEKYLSSVLSPAAQKPQLELLDQPVREIERISARKSAGIYYTPRYLVHQLTQRCIDMVIENRPDFPEKLPHILDLSCGSGSFLTMSVAYLIRRLRHFDGDKNWGKELVRQRCIVGIDKDRRAVMLARLSLWLRLAEEPNPLPLPRLEALIVEGDSLNESTWDKLPRNYEVVVGNPPFLPVGQVPSREGLAKRFKSAVGRFDYSYLFVELGIQKLTQQGVLGMVVPNRLFRNRDGSGIRKELTANCALKCVTDFGSNEVFRGVDAYIGTILVQRNSDHPTSDSVRYVRVLRLADKIAGYLLDTATSGDISNEYVRSFLTRAPTGEEPWLFLSPATMSARMRLEEESDALETVAGLFQGIKVGANDIFIVAVGEHTGTLTSVRNGLGEKDIIETDLLRPVVYGSEIQAYSHVQAKRYLLYPYQSGSPIAEEELRSRYPKALAYLNRYKTFLSARISIQTYGKQWFEIVRPRNEEWLSSPKLLIRDLATETSFGIDPDGSAYLVGGTAVVPADNKLLYPLLAYLNSRLVNWYLNPVTSAYRSDFQKFEPQHLQQIPVLRLIVENAEIQDRLGDLAAEAVLTKSNADEGRLAHLRGQIDAVLCGVIGVDPSEIL